MRLKNGVILRLSKTKHKIMVTQNPTEEPAEKSISVIASYNNSLTLMHL